MQYGHQTYAEAREQAYLVRARRARGWARLVLWVAAGVFLVAVWQDRALAPPVHDGMMMLTEKVRYALENSDSARDFIKQTFSSPTGTSREAEFDPITSWLLKWRN